jgi:cellulose synthase/poly-beta-1,6-N-acetylglucosamine synthase-like glycosyltransferase
VTVAVGIPAFNEAATVARAVCALLGQRGPHLNALELVVVASGCTDDTVGEARRAMVDDARGRVLVQARREGKASAIAAFLDAVPRADVYVIAGADGVLEDGALEALVARFDDPTVGMAGGRPVPVNDPGTRLGRVVRLLWEMHHHVALRSPKLGELVAFRRAFDAMPTDTAVDEAAIEALILAGGLRLAYVPEARVRMKGPTTVAEFLRQRRRIHAGHLRLRRASGHAPSTMGLGAILRAALDATPRTPGGILDLATAATLEATARALGAWDATVGGRDHTVWERIPSTKDLAP